jgi:hypothetical protein
MDKPELDGLRAGMNLGMSGDGILAQAIRGFEVDVEDVRDGHPLEGIFDALKEKNDQRIPIHQRAVFSINDQRDKDIVDDIGNKCWPYIGVEQTWPKPRYCNLMVDWSSVVSVSECDYYSPNKNLESWEIFTETERQFWIDFVAGTNNQYGLYDLLTFDSGLPASDTHIVCSMATALAKIKTLENDGIDVTKIFPPYWLTVINNHPSVGKVSPLGFDSVFKKLGWMLWQENP